jgi:hypothetical protein
MIQDMPITNSTIPRLFLPQPNGSWISWKCGNDMYLSNNCFYLKHSWIYSNQGLKFFAYLFIIVHSDMIQVMPITNGTIQRPGNTIEGEGSV